MTEKYTYKWVSATTDRSPGVSALQHAVANGWERVPFGKFPDDIEPPHQDPVKRDKFYLCRMPLEEHERRKTELQELNQALEDPDTHKERANDALGDNSVHGWSEIDTQSFSTDGKSATKEARAHAREWLEKRGL